METKKPMRHFNFLGGSRLAGTISALLVLVALVLLFVPGPNYGIDFAGGTNVIARFTESIQEDELRAVARTLGMDDAEVQRFGSADDNEFLLRTRVISSLTPEQSESVRSAVAAAFGEGAAVIMDNDAGDRFFVRLPRSAYGVEGGDDEPLEFEDVNALMGIANELSGRVQQAVVATGVGGVNVDLYGNPTDRRFSVRVAGLQSVIDDGLRAAFGERYVTIERIETVGPRVGEQLRNDSIKAVLLALAMILLYIAIRFDMRYAPGAVAALFHDVLITLGIFVIFRIEISLPIVAALLTIVGYSLNDTIVNFDRIRENLQEASSKESLEEIVNRSLNECLSRTLLTSGTTLTAVLAILFLGGGLIQSFALAMAIGIVVGTYSSIYIASPIMIWTSRELDKRKREVRVSRETVKG